MYRLTYWNKRGRGEQVRLLLSELGQPWDDAFFANNTPEFAALQAKGPSELMFQSVPMLQDGDFKLSQGPAILGYLGRKHGQLDPTDVQACARADAITLGAEDLRMGYFGLFGPGAAKKQRDYVEGRWSQRWLPAFDGLLELNGDTGFFVGGGCTWADIAVFDILDSMLEWVEGADLTAHPRLQRFFDGIHSRPGVAAYLASDRRAAG